MPYPYVFQIEFFPDDEKMKTRKESGLVYADTYAEAVEKITEYYGEEAIVSICSVTALDNAPIILPKSVCDKILNDSYIGEYDD